MPKEPVISNTSPLIGLWGLNLLSLFRVSILKYGFHREVEKEFLQIDEAVHREGLNRAPWIKTVDLTDPEQCVSLSIDSILAKPLCWHSQGTRCSSCHY